MSNTPSRTLIKLDQEMILDDLYELRSLICIADKEAREKLVNMISLIRNAPILNQTEGNFPKCRPIKG